MSAAPTMERLLQIMEQLRGPDGCQWDREQNLQTLRQYLIEECYEVIDAIEGGQPDRHAEELGDLLLQIVFQTQLQKERGHFNFDDVLRHICEKLIRRHPHVFGDTKVSGTDEVLRNWEAIKATEKRNRSMSADEPASIIGEVPRHLPALHKAHHIQKKVSRIGFDWTRVEEVMSKIEEELNEIRGALAAGDEAAVREEIGDLLFAVVNLSRFQGLNAEEVLNRSVDKFVRRFRMVEQRLQTAGRRLTDCPLEELEGHWQAVKNTEKNIQPGR
ncbi:MAG: nucleoside triphosphate pyrophosphohydrolase [Kiritimatiellia bacterium]|nr:nucleoside triphosphate pyrophosphohydrolase [Lentisphaerota bacterium]